MDCSPPGSSVHGILQARILEWVATPSSRDLPHPGIKPRSPSLQVDSLPSEPPEKLLTVKTGKMGWVVENPKVDVTHLKWRPFSAALWFFHLLYPPCHNLSLRKGNFSITLIIFPRIHQVIFCPFPHQVNKQSNEDFLKKKWKGKDVKSREGSEWTSYLSQFLGYRCKTWNLWAGEQGLY